MKLLFTLVPEGYNPKNPEENRPDHHQEFWAKSGIALSFENDISDELLAAQIRAALQALEHHLCNKMETIMTINNPVAETLEEGQEYPNEVHSNKSISS